MPDRPWICAECRSINPHRAGRCYHCRTPRAFALDLNGPGIKPGLLTEFATPAERARAAATVGVKYRSSAPYALLVRGAVFMISALTVVRLIQLMSLDFQAALGGSPSARLENEVIANVWATVAWYGAWVAAGIPWGLWLRRVVANVPALGGGWPAATPRSAFLESLIPGFNLVFTARILRDAIQRLSGERRPNLTILTTWWVCLAIAGLLLVEIGPSFWVRRILEIVVGIVIGLLGGLSAIVGLAVVIQAFGYFLVLIAAVLVLWLMASVERLERARAADLRANEVPARPLVTPGIAPRTAAVAAARASLARPDPPAEGLLSDVPGAFDDDAPLEVHPE